MEHVMTKMLLKDGMWPAVDRLIDAAPDDEALRAQGIVPLAIRRRRGLGLPLSDELLHAERVATFGALSVSALLARARESHAGRMMLFKGPLVARGYPGSARASVDIDLIVENAAEAQRDFIAAGFVEVDEPELFEDIHHLRPLRWEQLPILNIELHSTVKWPERMQAPDVGEIFAAGVDGETGVDGILAPDPHHHTMMVAAHGWSHGPLRSLRDLLDVAVVAEGLDRAELTRLADRWDLGTVWRTTERALDHLFGDARKPWSMRLWAPHLEHARERTVFETHVEHWIAPFWGLPFRKALAEGAGSLWWELKPVGHETWREKATRTWAATRRANVASSRHAAELGDLATKGDLRRIVRERRAAEDRA
jgi:hypothetical protein